MISLKQQETYKAVAILYKENFIRKIKEKIIKID